MSLRKIECANGLYRVGVKSVEREHIEYRLEWETPLNVSFSPTEIVLEARVALEEAQYPRSKTPVDFERSISRLSNLTNRRSVDNFVKLAKDNQSVLGDDAMATKAPRHRPSMSMETGPSYHLRRQRSDLTNFRSMQFQPIVEQELPESSESSVARPSCST